MLAHDERREAERHLRRRHERAPQEGAIRRVDSGRPRAESRAGPEEDRAEHRHRQRDDAERRERVDLHRRADRREEQHEHRHRAALDRVAQDVAGLAHDVLHDETGREPREQRLEVKPGAEAREQREQREEDDGRFRGRRTADTAQNSDPSRPPNAIDPTDHPDQSTSATARLGALLRAERRARRLHADREAQDHEQLDTDDDRRGDRRERSARAAFGDDGGREDRRDADEQRADERRRRRRRSSPVSSAPIGSQRQKTKSTAAIPTSATATVVSAQPDDRAESRPQARTFSCRPGDERDDDDREAADHAKVARHRLGDEVRDRGTADQTEDQVAGDARQPEELEQPADDRRRRRARRRARARSRFRDPSPNRTSTSQASQIVMPSARRRRIT